MPFVKDDKNINRAGRPKGSKGFVSLFKEAVKKIAKTQNIKECDVEIDLVIKAIAEAKKGNFQFYKDIFDRTYGKAKDSLDVTSGGKPIPLLNVLNNPSNKESPQTDKED